MPKYEYETITKNPIGTKPQILVDPPPRYVYISRDLARARGLRGHNNGSAAVAKSESEDEESALGQFMLEKGNHGEKFFRRRAKIAPEDRQYADLSISHDGEYATAVCMALDEGAAVSESQAEIIDDGTGPPLHEPEWGDNGFLSKPKEKHTERHPNLEAAAAAAAQEEQA